MVNPYHNNNDNNNQGVVTMNGSFDDYDSVIDGNSFAIGRIHHGNDDFDDVSSIHMSEIGSQITNSGNSHPYGNSGNGIGNRNSGKHDGNYISGKNNNERDLGIDASDVSAILGVYSSSNHISERNSNATYYSTDASQGENCAMENNVSDVDNNGNNIGGSSNDDETNQNEARRKTIKLGPLGDELSFAGNVDDDENNDGDRANQDNAAETAMEMACVGKEFDKNNMIYDNEENHAEDEDGFLPNWIYKSSRKVKCLVVVSIALFMGCTVVAGVALAMANTENNIIGGDDNGGGRTAAIEDGITEGEQIITPTLSPAMATNIATISTIPTKSPVLSTTGEAFNEEKDNGQADQQVPDAGNDNNSKTNDNEVNNPTIAGQKTSSPSKSPMNSPTTQLIKPSNTSPTRAPITAKPTSTSPTTYQPSTDAPSISPTTSPTTFSTVSPTIPPTTNIPTVPPSRTPTISPTDLPTSVPATNSPTTSSSERPSTASPTVIRIPTAMPSVEPSSLFPDGGTTFKPSFVSPTLFPTAFEGAVGSVGDENEVDDSEEREDANDDDKDNDDANDQVETITEGMNMGTEATIEGDATFYLMSDGANNVAFWESQLSALDVEQSGAKFLVHLGSASRRVDDCARSAYTKAKESLTNTPVPVYSLPGNFDWPECSDPESGWKHYQDHMMNINTNWDTATDYVVYRQQERPENFSFLWKRVLFVGIHMVTNSDADETNERVMDNIQWVNQNVEKHQMENIDAIFVMGNERLLATENIAFYEHFSNKKKNVDEWNDVLFVYSRRSGISGLSRDIGGVTDLHELRVGSEWPIMDVRVQTGNVAGIQFRTVSSRIGRASGGGGQDGLI